jgi:hypothetical protein
VANFEQLGTIPDAIDLLTRRATGVEMYFDIYNVQ